MAATNDEGRLSGQSDLVPVLRALPGPPVLAGLGVALLGLGGYLIFGGTGFVGGLLRLAAYPVLTLGFGGLALAYGKARYRGALVAWQSSALDEAAQAMAERVTGYLAATPDGATVQAMAAALGVDQDDVVLGLGHLDRHGRIDEILDERTGEFLYALLPEGETGDPASHVSLGQRLEAVRRARMAAEGQRR